MRSELADAVLQVVWGQWTALGVSGTVPVPDHAIDLEALVSFTPTLQQDDPRLYEEALDWCVQHSHRLISITRLRRLRAALPNEARDAYDDFAASVNATAKPKTPWPTNRSGTWLQTSKKSQPPEIDRRRELLQLRLRCLFGVTARADVLLQFLRPGMVNELLPNMTLATSTFDDIGYSKPALAEVLADFTMAGLLEKWRRGNRDYYDLRYREELVSMVGGALPGTAPNWGSRFRVLAHLLIAEAATQKKKPVVQTDAIIKVLDHHRAMLERSAVRLPTRVYDWKELTPWVKAALLDQLDPTQDISRWHSRMNTDK